MDQMQPTQPMQSTQPAPKQGARNFFLYFLNFALLYTVAINFGGILFDLINKAFPLVGDYARGRFSQSSLRFHLASLIIGTPIFLWLSWKVYTEGRKDEGFNKSALRRWLTYITLIITALVVIGDLIFLVNNLLSGETTARIILKALSVLVIAGAVLFYYLTDIKSMRYDVSQGPQPANPLPRAYFIGTAIIVLAAIVTGIFQLEPPATQRQRRQDDVRIQHLQEIENSIANYVSLRQGLPSSLVAIQIREDVTRDPITKQPYEYRVLDADSYELCVTFETSNKTGERDEYSPYGYYGSAWLHDKGRACFERTVRNQLQKESYPVPLR